MLAGLIVVLAGNDLSEPRRRAHIGYGEQDARWEFMDGMAQVSYREGHLIRVLYRLRVECRQGAPRVTIIMAGLMVRAQPELTGRSMKTRFRWSPGDTESVVEGTVDADWNGQWRLNMDDVSGIVPLLKSQDSLRTQNVESELGGWKNWSLRGSSEAIDALACI